MVVDSHSGIGMADGIGSRKPLCVLYSNGESVTAALVSPTNDNIREETSSGPFAALGLLKDQGFDFGELFEDDIPDWVTGKVPKKVKIIGAANITGFPI